MFMDNNRRKNGAANPATTASQDSSNQRRSRQLAPNGPIPGNPDDPRFTPDMSSPDAINEAHYQGGISGSGPFSKSYEDKMPSIGDRALSDQKLKGR